MVGNRFMNSYVDWKEGTYENFKDWVVRQFDLKDGESEEEEDFSAQIPKARDIFFTKKKKEVYILPPMSNFKTVFLEENVDG